MWDGRRHARYLLTETRTGSLRLSGLRVEEFREPAAFVGRIVTAPRKVDRRGVKGNTSRKCTRLWSPKLSERRACFAGVSEDSSFSSR